MLREAKLGFLLMIDLGEAEHRRQRRQHLGLLRRRVEVPARLQRVRQDLRLLRQMELRRGHRQDPLHRHLEVHRPVDRNRILGHATDGQLLYQLCPALSNRFLRSDKAPERWLPSLQ